MRGLLLKDFYVVRGNFRLQLGLIVFMSAASLFMESGALYLAMPMLFAGMIPIYILSVEEKWGWAEYAETLSAARRDVVTGKYLTALASVGGTLLLMLALHLARLAFAGGDIGALLCSLSVVTAFGLIFSTATLPCMFRFGVEKGRIVTLAVTGVLVALYFALELGPVQDMAGGAADPIAALGPRVFAVLAGALALFALSWRLSVRLYETREL